MSEKRLALNQREAAEVLGVHPHTLRRLIAEGRIQCVRVGRRVLIPIGAIERFLEPPKRRYRKRQEMDMVGTKTLAEGLAELDRLYSSERPTLPPPP